MERLRVVGLPIIDIGYEYFDTVRKILDNELTDTGNGVYVCRINIDDTLADYLKAWYNSYSVVYASVSIGEKCYRMAPIDSTGGVMKFKIGSSVESGTSKLKVFFEPPIFMKAHYTMDRLVGFKQAMEESIVYNDDQLSCKLDNKVAVTFINKWLEGLGSRGGTHYFGLVTDQLYFRTANNVGIITMNGVLYKVLPSVVGPDMMMKFDIMGEETVEAVK